MASVFVGRNICEAVNQADLQKRGRKFTKRDNMAKELLKCIFVQINKELQIKAILIEALTLACVQIHTSLTESDFEFILNMIRGILKRVPLSYHHP